MHNRDLRPAVKANPTIQQAFERFQKYNRLKNLSQGSLDFYAAKGRSFFRFLGDTEQPIHTITEETVEDYIFYMYEGPAAPRYDHQYEPPHGACVFVLVHGERVSGAILYQAGAGR